MSTRIPQSKSFHANMISPCCNAAKFCLVILGSSGVGKTSLVSRSLYDKLDDNYQPTIQSSHFKDIMVNDFTLKLQVIDTTGKNEFPAMRKWSIMHGDAFALVYSIDDLTSFAMLEVIYHQILEEKRGKDYKIFMIGNKTDLEDDRQVDQSSACSTASKWGCEHMEISAKNDRNVYNVFFNILRQSSLPCRISLEHLKPTPTSWDVDPRRKKLSKIKSVAVMESTASTRRNRMLTSKRKMTSQSCIIS